LDDEVYLRPARQPNDFEAKRISRVEANFNYLIKSDSEDGSAHPQSESSHVDWTQIKSKLSYDMGMSAKVTTLWSLVEQLVEPREDLSVQDLTHRANPSANAALLALGSKDYIELREETPFNKVTQDDNKPLFELRQALHVIKA
jgi:hypothetical protein